MDNISERVGDILIYKSENGEIKIDVYMEENNVWLTQKSLAELYQVSVPTINEHIKNIISEKELDENSTIRNFRIVQQEGGRNVSRNTNFYNLDMILAISS